MAGHAIQNAHEFLRVMVGTNNALERMAVRASLQGGLLFWGSWETGQPISVG